MSLLIASTSAVLASDSDRDLSLHAKLGKASGKPIGTYRALIIGINDYRDRKIPDLKTAVNDAREIANVLKKDYGFKEVTLLLNKDANESRIIKELRRLISKSSENDSVLIYYAGHGDLDKATRDGWWIPYNATAQDPSTYIENTSIQKYVKAIPAQHILVVADSCFSGALFGEARALPPVIDDKFYASLFKEKSRWGMTSGNFTPVSDSGSKGHSIFAYQFLKTLKDNENPYLTPREIYQKIGPIIRNNSEQMPVTRPIRNTGDQGGEFIFIRTAALSSGASMADVAPELSIAPEFNPPFQEGNQGGVTKEIGDIFIESEPSGAMVYLDGVRKKRTPFELNDVPAGKHTIELKKGKIYSARLEIDLEPDDFVKRKVKLKRAKGNVKLSSEPTGTKIFLDGKDTGKTTPDVIHTEAGEHELKLEKKTGKGRVIHKSRIKVEPDRRVSLLITDFEEKSSEDMVFIAGGCFEMGNQFGEGSKDEKPVHEVCVDDFYMGEHEVTVGEFRDFVNETAYKTEAEKEDGCFYYTGSKWKKSKSKYWNNPGFSQTDRSPVTCMSWNDANHYTEWKSRQTGSSIRLPTEAEWEYAAREGGRRMKFAGFSNEGDLSKYANFCDSNCNFAWKTKNQNDGYKYTSPVKLYRPNNLGLYDMSGNVWEWVSDWYDKDYYRNSPRKNPIGPKSGEYRLLRGGSWYDAPVYVRAANRFGDGPDERDGSDGFRIAQD
tara:strand:+ start:674 stop:2836 length:2163 start_codon:yes stop_codon:yes gene_type:complete